MVKLLKFFVCKKGPMSRSLILKDYGAKQVLLMLKQLLSVDVSDARLIVWFCIYTFAAGSTLVGQRLYGLRGTALLVLFLYALGTVEIFFARSSGVGGLGLPMAFGKVFTSSPIQLYKIRGILRANRAPALVYKQLAVA
jgi:hypothetical protein